MGGGSFLMRVRKWEVHSLSYIFKLEAIRILKDTLNLSLARHLFFFSFCINLSRVEKGQTMLCIKISFSLCQFISGHIITSYDLCILYSNILWVCQCIGTENKDIWEQMIRDLSQRSSANATTTIRLVLSKWFMQCAHRG